MAKLFTGILTARGRAASRRGIFPRRFLTVLLLVAFLSLFFGAGIARANNTPAALPFSQNWSNTALITVDDAWSGVASIIGYRGDNLTALQGADPQTLLANDPAPVVDVVANQANPNALITGGVAEFDGIANPTVALQGSGTADAPYLMIFLNTTGLNNIRVAYDVRDLDGSPDNAVQPVALHYRVGASGNFTNLPGAFVADATTGPGLSSLVTPVNVPLPAAANNQPLVELRIMTANAVGNDEWVGIDNISVTANSAPTGYSVTPASVLENQPAGTVVGTVAASDPNPGDTHTFALVASVLCAGGGADNAYFSLSGNTLLTAVPFDYETRNTYNICIQVTDNNGLSMTGSYTINILNVVDETPPTVTINQSAAQPDPTNASPILFTVVFSEPVTGFAANDVDLSGSTAGGALNATATESAPNDGTTYTVSVSGMTAGGLVSASVLPGAAVDGSGNASLASTSTDNTVTFSTDTSSPTVTIDQAASQPDPTNASPILFTATFSEPVTGFTGGGVDLTSSTAAGALTAVVSEAAPNDGTTYTVSVSGMTAGGLVRASVLPGAAADALGNPSLASTSADNSVTYTTDTAPPRVVASTPADGVTLLTGLASLSVGYSEPVRHDAGPGAADNPLNYLLVEAGADASFESLSCLGGPAGDDARIPVDSVTYTDHGGGGPFTALLSVHGGVPLPVGSYRLLVCGTTSIEDLAGNKLNGGLSDAAIAFTVARPDGLPSTGFPMGEVTRLPIQPSEKGYASYPRLWLEIPSLDVSAPIVGVPLTSGGWDVTWLGSEAGWLNGTAFPGWSGNSVLTAHVWDAYNRPGPFSRLKDLRYGHRVIVHAFGLVYTYEVRATQRLSPGDLPAVFQHETHAWLTLLTCEDYQSPLKTYAHRRMVRAVLVRVDTE